MFLFMALPSGSVGAQRQSCVIRLRSEGYAQRARRAATQFPHWQRRLERQRPAAKVKAAPETNSGSVPELHERCGLHGFRVHDLRHTVGMGLRETGVPESTRADISGTAMLGRQRTTRSRRWWRFVKRWRRSRTRSTRTTCRSPRSFATRKSPLKSHRSKTARSGAGFRPLAWQ